MGGRGEYRIGVVGAGAMAQAFVGGLIGSGLVPPSAVRVHNRRDEGEREIFRRMGVAIAMEKRDLCAAADVVVLAVKPKDAAEALSQLAAHVQPHHLVLSLMAGVPTEYIARRLGGGTRVVRAMANTSSAVRESATGIALGSGAGPADLACAEELLSALGRVVPVPEEALDAVTALAGSGPAYVFLLIEALIAAGRAQGLTQSVAADLTLQTVYGAAKMVLETGLPPEDLRRRVSSPGGTTLAALDVLERDGFRSSMARAVQRARERSLELAAAFSED